MALRDLINSINKSDGDNTVKFFGNDVNLPKLSTGVFTLDGILRGGIPRASITEILGMESTGKSTLCYHIIASVQKTTQGKNCVYIDMEHAFNPQYAQIAGVDLDNLLFVQPSNGNKALDYVEKFARTGEVSLIIVDSVAALVTEQEDESSMNDNGIGLGTAKLMAKFCRKIPPVLSTTDTTLIMVNQWREKPTMYGDPKVPYGGNSLKYTAKLRLDLQKAEELKESKETIGFRIRVKVLKNKCGGDPLKLAYYNIIFGKGIDELFSLLEYGFEVPEVITKSGNTYYCDETKIAVGKDAAIAAVRSNPDLFALICEKALNHISNLAEPTEIVFDTIDEQLPDDYDEDTEET